MGKSQYEPSTKALMEMNNKPEDMRMKKCKICGRIKKIHKFDCYCTRCRASADRIIHSNARIH